jgi:hypothetical protein
MNVFTRSNKDLAQSSSPKILQKHTELKLFVKESLQSRREFKIQQIPIIESL